MAAKPATPSPIDLWPTELDRLAVERRWALRRASIQVVEDLERQIAELVAKKWVLD
jgi:hypothetical protein